MTFLLCASVSLSGYECLPERFNLYTKSTRTELSIKHCVSATMAQMCVIPRRLSSSPERTLARFALPHFLSNPNPPFLFCFYKSLLKEVRKHSSYKAFCRPHTWFFLCEHWPEVQACQDQEELELLQGYIFKELESHLLALGTHDC